MLRCSESPSLAILAAGALSAMVACAACAPGAATRSGFAPSSRAGLEAALDSVIADEMSRSHIPGAVVVVVRGGEVYVSKGYGYADLRDSVPVDPERTIFRIGSISKVFTATALVQLADRGRVRLDEDVNAYLPGWKVPAPYGRPVTSEHLLGHTAGFDEISPGRKAARPQDVLPLSEFLRERLVPRFAPGDHISYSTYGIALAGHLVEQVSGAHLSAYMEREIFTPLQMHGSSVGLVPEALRADAAVGYAHGPGGYAPEEWEHFHTYPASDVNATGADMAKFMISHLQRGRYGGGRILSDSAAARMHRTHFRNHPGLLGTAYGFFEARLNGHPALYHSGSMNGYAATMWLWPEQGTGVFIAANREVASLAQRVVRRVAARMLPRVDGLETEDTPWTGPRVRDDLSRFAGRYRWDAWCHSCTGERGYVPRALDVTVADDSTIAFWGGEWGQVEPLLFRLMNGQLDHGELYVVFRADSAGRIVGMDQGPFRHERVADAGAAAPAVGDVHVDERVLADYTGRYRLPDGMMVTVTRVGGTLFGEAPGLSRLVLRARTPTVFTAAELDAELVFSANAGQKASQFLLRRAGQPDAVAHRID
ncbi:MAG TPA: serine hydrolase [Longimicrobium sp.]|jgi:CubicO group peptidase (beta-lactamase class C family)